MGKKIKKTLIQRLIGIILTVSIILFYFTGIHRGIESVFAANTVMEVLPNSGGYPVGTSVKVDVVIDGHGDAFNAAKATVSLSNNLNLQDVTLGDCNFSFVTTPTINNPSYAGVILGGFSNKCTVYSLTVLPLSVGTGTINITNAEVKRYGNAEDTLTSLQGGSYIITSTSSGTSSITVAPQNQSTAQTQITNQNSPYSLTLKAVGSDNLPVVGATVVLDPPDKTSQSTVAPSPATTQATVTDNSGTARFSNVPKGIHTAVITDQNTPVAKTILNINGTNHAITLGIKTQKQPFNLSLLVLGIMITFALLIALFFLIRYFPLLKKIGSNK